mgnify:FL=1|tara:strand:- start:19 stop:840 length:822 start_codon:yes stop_codon:yes gene_type:complete
MQKNLVLSAAFGFSIKSLELFIKSLRKFYNGDICFIIGLNDDELEKELKKHNCISVRKNIDKRDIQSKRYEIFADFLEKTNYSNVLCCDGRDIYFQSNPFDFNFKKPINFFLEDKQIKDCPYNSNWILKTYKKKGYDLVKNKIILCSGTVLGNKEKILEYLHLMKKNIKKFKYSKSLKYFLTFRRDPQGRGCDQGHANYIVNNNLIKDLAFYTNSGGPVATVFYLKNIIFDKNSNLLNSNNHPYSVVHQYDKRWDEFSEAVKNIKKNLHIVDY